MNDPGFMVRQAMTDEDLDGARKVIIRVLEEDLKTGIDPAYHSDLDHMHEVYVDHPRQAMFVAVDIDSGEVIGTTAIREDGPKSPPHPAWLAERYAGDDVAQIFRVYIASEHRRRGAARALVAAAQAFVAETPGYSTIYLHTNPEIPGAEKFWRSMPTVEVYDDLGIREDGMRAIHFELDIPETS
ncbi:MAG: GNAT family N-acetyltransferase [Thermomicrobiales bacterium]|nr:GNAT family N-acetyltransferase [Thermomicrobiales bacterium]